VLSSLLAKGYAISRYGEGLESRMAGRSVEGPAPGCRGIEIDPTTNTVRIPDGSAFDAGGIGKGLAADIVTEEIIEAGAVGALVNLGGDLRVRGRAPDAEAWVVDIEDPFDPERSLITVRIGEGAIASSSTLIRTWVHRGVAEHHLVDPRTGDRPGNGVVAATVVAGSGWMAEAFSKVAMVASTPVAALEIIEAAELTGLIIKKDHTLEIGTNLGAFL